MGFRVMELAPLVISTDARSGWNGSRVVPRRMKRLAASPAIDRDTSETVVATALRLVLGGGNAPERARCVTAAPSAASGGGMCGTVTILRGSDRCVETVLIAAAMGPLS